MFRARNISPALLPMVVFVSCLALSSAAQSDAPAKPDASRKEANAPDPDNAKIVAGLEQAIEISTTRALAETGKRDGFLQNEAIRILLPPKLQAIGKSMRMLAMGDEVDELEIGMNRAAEEATGQAKPIFLGALKSLVFRDPRLILTSGDTAATEYFRRNSSSDIAAAFTPIVHHALEHLGVIKQYKRVLKNDPGGNAIANEFDLDKYVVEQALDGIFNVMASEESNIRQNPEAQNSDIIKEVFGGK